MNIPLWRLLTHLLCLTVTSSRRLLQQVFESYVDIFAPEHCLVTAHVGSPPQPIQMVLDTASALTHVNCLRSSSDTSKSNQHFFAMTRSSSLHWVNCTNGDLCRMCVHSGHLQSFSFSNTTSMICALAVSDEVIHAIASDKFSMHSSPNSNSSLRDAIFGCSVVNSSREFDANILALNRGPHSFTQQFYSSHNGVGKQFAHHFVPSNQVRWSSVHKGEVFSNRSNIDDHTKSPSNAVDNRMQSYLAVGGDHVSNFLKDILQYLQLLPDMSAWGGSDEIQWIPFYSRVFVETNSLLWTDETVTGVADYSLFEPKVPNSDLYQVVTDALFINEIVIFVGTASIVTIDTGDTSLSFSHELKNSILTSIFGVMADMYVWSAGGPDIVLLFTNDDENAQNQKYASTYFRQQSVTVISDRLNDEITQLLKYYEYCVVSSKDDLIFADIIVSLFSEHISHQLIIPSNNYVVKHPAIMGTYYCFDMTFDWNGGVVLGSSALKNWVIAYDDDTEQLGILPTAPETKYGNFHANITYATNEYKYNVSQVNETVNGTTTTNTANLTMAEEDNTDNKNDKNDKFYQSTVEIFDHDINMLFFIILLILIGIFCFILLPCCCYKCWLAKQQQSKHQELASHKHAAYELDFVVNNETSTSSTDSSLTDMPIGDTQTPPAEMESISMPKASRIRNRSRQNSTDHECHPQRRKASDITSYRFEEVTCNKNQAKEGFPSHPAKLENRARADLPGTVHSRRSSTSSVFQSISGKVSRKLRRSARRGSRSRSQTITATPRTTALSLEEQERQQRDILNQLKLLNDIEKCQSDVDLSDCDNTELFLDNWQHYGSHVIRQLEYGKEQMIFDTINDVSEKTSTPVRSQQI